MEELASLHRLTFDHVQLNLRREARRRQLTMDRRSGAALRTEPLPVGTVVMRRVHVREDKTSPAWTGPFWVVRQATSGNYVLRDAAGDPLPRSVPLNHLKVVREGLVEAKAEPVRILRRRVTPLGEELLVQSVTPNAKGRRDTYWIDADASVGERDASAELPVDE